jgi:hypothetical protein
MVSEFGQRHRVMTVEPPIVPVMRRQRRQEIELILLAAGAAGGADQAGLVRGDACNQRVARPIRDVPAHSRKGCVRLAANEQAENLDVAGVSRGQSAG